MDKERERERVRLDTWGKNGSKVETNPKTTVLSSRVSLAEPKAEAKPIGTQTYLHHLLLLRSSS